MTAAPTTSAMGPCSSRSIATSCEASVRTWPPIRRRSASRRGPRPVRKASAGGTSWIVCGNRVAAIEALTATPAIPTTRSTGTCTCEENGFTRTVVPETSFIFAASRATISRIVPPCPWYCHSHPPAGSDANDDLVLVMHPDEFISPTLVSEAVKCPRPAVLQSRLGSTGLSAKSAVVGTLRHDLFERCLRERDV